MKHGLLLAGAIATGISAAYLLDVKRGPKRRKLLKKKADRVWREASQKLNDYSHELKPYWDKYSKELIQDAGNVAEEGVQHLEKATQNGWAPSARMIGATASAMAFYGAGRKGVIGTMLRVVSLGLFTRALLASK